MNLYRWLSERRKKTRNLNKCRETRVIRKRKGFRKMKRVGAHEIVYKDILALEERVYIQSHV
jgi:hypothetical protein